METDSVEQTEQNNSNSSSYDCVIYSYLPINLDTARLEAFSAMMLFMDDIKHHAFVPK